MFDVQAFRAAGESDKALDPRSRLQALRRSAAHDDAADRAGPDYSVAPPEPVPRTRLRRIAERWLPDSLLRSRVDPGRAGVLAIALVAVAVLLGVAAMSWTSRSAAEPAPPPVLPPPLPVTTAVEPELVISVVGQVERPGLVTVEPGSRVADAVGAAGGALPDTDLTGLNLARRLTDGEQLYVAVPVPPQAAAGRTGDGKVDLNTATEEQLDELPGVGEVTAKRIVQWRSEHGRFESVEQLRDVGGIGSSRFAKLRELVRV